jgi:hypothetical protein
LAQLIKRLQNQALGALDMARPGCFHSDTHFRIGYGFEGGG